MIFSQFAPATFDLAALAPIARLIPPRVPETGPAEPVPMRAPVPAFEEMRLKPAEAARMLPTGPVIHVVSARWRDRWSPQRARSALHAATRIRLTLSARSAGFGLSLDQAGADAVLIETDRNEVAAWLARQADKLARR